MTQYNPSDFFGHVAWWAEVEPAVIDHDPCAPFSVALIADDGALLMHVETNDGVEALMHAVQTARAVSGDHSIQLADGTRSVIAYCNVHIAGIGRWVMVDAVLGGTLDEVPLDEEEKQMIRLSARGELDDLLQA